MDLVKTPNCWFSHAQAQLHNNDFSSKLSLDFQVTVKEQQEWKIPPCISNWKNVKGYTIPLDKRLAADGRGLQGVHINENFAKFAEALYIADRKVSTMVLVSVLI